jgi:hypothetical protein
MSGRGALVAGPFQYSCREGSFIYKAKMVKGPNRNFQGYDPLDFLAAVTAHITDRREHLVRYYGSFSTSPFLIPNSHQTQEQGSGAPAVAVNRPFDPVFISSAAPLDCQAAVCVINTPHGRSHAAFSGEIRWSCEKESPMGHDPLSSAPFRSILENPLYRDYIVQTGTLGFRERPGRRSEAKREGGPIP